MIERSRLGGKKMRTEEDGRRRGRNGLILNFGEEDETAQTTISTGPFNYSFWSPLTARPNAMLLLLLCHSQGYPLCSNAPRSRRPTGCPRGEHVTRGLALFLPHVR